MGSDAGQIRWRAALAALAALSGAAGVALAAVAAHRVAEPTLATAAQFLILHAAAVTGLVALAAGVIRPTLHLAAASIMLFGVVLFSGDISARVLLGGSLFPMAAPIGGSSMMLAWLIAALASAREFMTGRK
ncbi:MAG: DUF423 domain-containing protein [Hyphomicrobium sp.]|jgi:uncharacterized membrane protein YgdD (TMEM256/DUF423 family)